MGDLTYLPDQQRTSLMKFRLSSEAEIFVDSHRLSMQLGAKRVQKRVCNVRIFQPSFHFAYHRCWSGFFFFSFFWRGWGGDVGECLYFHFGWKYI